MPYADPERRRACKREWARAHPDVGRRWKAANPNKVQESQAKHRAANREVIRERDKVRRRSESYRKRKREWEQRWRAANPETARATVRRWQKANPEVGRAAVRRRRARKAGVPTDGHARAQVWERDGGVCQLCFTPLDPANWHEDHIIPLVAGGPDTLENVQAACPPCNLSKGAKTVAA